MYWTALELFVSNWSDICLKKRDVWLWAVNYVVHHIDNGAAIGSVHSR